MQLPYIEEKHVKAIQFRLQIVLFMVVGLSGGNGVLAVNHVESLLKLEKELAQIQHQNMVEERALEVINKRFTAQIYHLALKSLRL